MYEWPQMSAYTFVFIIIIMYLLFYSALFLFASNINLDICK